MVTITNSKDANDEEIFHLRVGEKERLTLMYLVLIFEANNLCAIISFGWIFFEVQSTSCHMVKVVTIFLFYFILGNISLPLSNKSSSSFIGKSSF